MSATSNRQADLVRSAASQLAQPPSTKLEQESLLRQHPMRRKAYTMVTPALLRSVLIVQYAVLYRWRSCCFVGASGVGKTYAKSYIVQRLRESFPGIYVIDYSCSTWHIPNPVKFCTSLFETSGATLRDPDAGRTQDPRKALARNWQARALSQGADHIVLVFDEFQNCRSHELQCLAEICNECNELQLRCTVVTFGSEALSHLKNGLLATEKHYLVTRFFNVLIRYEGIESLEDLAVLMKSYDDKEQAEYPPKSGWSFARFFLPRAFEMGWRLESEASALWESFVESVTPPKKRQHIALRTECVTSAVESALIENRSFAGTSAPLDQEDWTTAVTRSNFMDSLGYSCKSLNDIKTTAEATLAYGIDVKEAQPNG